MFGLESLLPFAGAAIGQLAHMVQKKSEVNREANDPTNPVVTSEIGVLKDLVFNKPANTLMAIVGAQGLVNAVPNPFEQIASMDVGQMLLAFLSFITIGFGVDSGVNRHK